MAPKPAPLVASIVLIVGTLAGCAPRSGANAPPREPSQSANGAAEYTTEPAALPVRGGEQGKRLEAALVQVAKSRGLQLEGDGRLAELAIFVASHIDDDGRPPTREAVEAYAHHLGLIEPVPLLMIFGDAHEDHWTEPITARLNGSPKNVGYNRFGIGIAPNLGQQLAVIALSAAYLDIDPLPREVEEGAKLLVQGSLRGGYSRAQLDVTQPDGTVKHVADATGSSFRFTIPPAAHGIEQVEVLADGPFGVTVLANFPVFAGLREPPIMPMARANSRSADEPEDEHTIAKKLLALLNEARQKAGVPPLAPHAELAEVAEAHSRDMVASGFFGHVSPTSGDVASRVRKKGLGFVLLAENLGSGTSAEELNAMLLDSPGHRANALDPNLTHVGIGVAVDRNAGRMQIVATEDFAGIAARVDTARAPGEVVDLLNKKRSAAGLGKLVADPTLTQAAQAGAELFFREPGRTQDSVVAGVNQTLTRPSGPGGVPIGRRMRTVQSFMIQVVSLDHVDKIEATRDPAAHYVGVGVAQGTRPETGPNAIVLVVVLGWSR